MQILSHSAFAFLYPKQTWPKWKEVKATEKKAFKRENERETGEKYVCKTEKVLKKVKQKEK